MRYKGQELEFKFSVRSFTRIPLDFTRIEFICCIKIKIKNNIHKTFYNRWGVGNLLIINDKLILNGAPKWEPINHVLRQARSALALGYLGHDLGLLLEIGPKCGGQ